MPKFNPRGMVFSLPNDRDETGSSASTWLDMPMSMKLKALGKQHDIPVSQIIKYIIFNSPRSIDVMAQEAANDYHKAREKRYSEQADRLREIARKRVEDNRAKFLPAEQPPVEPEQAEGISKSVQMSMYNFARSFARNEVEKWTTTYGATILARQEELGNKLDRLITELGGLERKDAGK